MKHTFLAAILSLISGGLSAQQFVFPQSTVWTTVQEGKPVTFNLSITDPASVVGYSIDGGAEFDMRLDSTGHFDWTPSYDLADRFARQREVTVVFQVDMKEGKRLRQPVTFLVHHVNRPPIVEDLPTFYVRQGVPNHYQIPDTYVRDPDGDPLLFKAQASSMPEGAALSSLGQFTWNPGRQQFNSLKSNPITIDFTVQDQPEKSEVVGHLRIAQTQLDLPPELLIVPADTAITIHENDAVYVKVYVADPNGDDNIEQVGFVSSDSRLDKSLLKANSPVQQEFNWKPGYDFTEEAEKKKEVSLVFFAFDKSSNRVQRKIRITVLDRENVEEKDKLLQQKYFNSLAATKSLIDALDENNLKLEEIYKKARKGKKSRTILNASLGAMTGLSPLVLETDPSKAVSVVGGTTVLTLNSLEAGQVIGRNANEFQNRIKTNRDLRTQLQLKGHYFARKYSLKSARRSVEFEQDRDDLTRLMNSDALASLEIRADARPVPTAKEIKKAFPDFNEER